MTALIAKILTCAALLLLPTCSLAPHHPAATGSENPPPPLAQRAKSIRYLRAAEVAASANDPQVQRILQRKAGGKPDSPIPLHATDFNEKDLVLLLGEQNLVAQAIQYIDDIDIDRGHDEFGSSIFVYHLEHADAQATADFLHHFFGPDHLHPRYQSHLLRDDVRLNEFIVQPYPSDNSLLICLDHADLQYVKTLLSKIDQSPAAASTLPAIPSNRASK
jgi:hypothetical protein